MAALKRNNINSLTQEEYNRQFPYGYHVEEEKESTGNNLIPPYLPPSLVEQPNIGPPPLRRSKSNSSTNVIKVDFLTKMTIVVLELTSTRLNQIIQDQSINEQQKEILKTLIKTLKNEKSIYHNILKLHLLYILSSNIYQDVSIGLKTTLNEYNVKVTEETKQLVRQLPRNITPYKKINNLTRKPLPNINNLYENAINEEIENEFKTILINNGSADEEELNNKNKLYREKIEKIIHSLESRLKTTYNPDDITLQNYYRLYSNKLRSKISKISHKAIEKKDEMIDYALQKVSDSYNHMKTKYDERRQEYATRRAELIEQDEPASISATVLLITENLIRDTIQSLYTKVSELKQTIIEKLKNANRNAKKLNRLNTYKSIHYRSEQSYFNASGLSLFFSENPNIIHNALILFPIIIDIINQSGELRMGIPSYLKEILNNITSKKNTLKRSSSTSNKTIITNNRLIAARRKFERNSRTRRANGTGTGTGNGTRKRRAKGTGNGNGKANVNGNGNRNGAKGTGNGNGKANVNGNGNRNGANGNGNGANGTRKGTRNVRRANGTRKGTRNVRRANGTRNVRAKGNGTVTGKRRRANERANETRKKSRENDGINNEFKMETEIF